MFPAKQGMGSFKHEAFDMIDSVTKELNGLQEKVLKLNVQAQMLEVDIATQFSPNTILEIKRLEQKCQDSIKAQEEMTNQTIEKIDSMNVPNYRDVEIQ